MKKGIIFDLDGTLWDSSKQVVEAWNRAIAQSTYERKPLTMMDMQHVMGKTMDVIAEILFPDLELEKRTALLDACCLEENDYLRRHGGVLYPGVAETMKQLTESGYHLYMVSNCQSGYIEAFLDYYKLWDLVEDIECYGNNHKQKGENIALVIKRNQLEETAYVGDIQGDYDATMAAGEILGQNVTFVHAAYGFGTIVQKVKRIEAFQELTQLFPISYNKN